MSILLSNIYKSIAKYPIARQVQSITRLCAYVHNVQLDNHQHKLTVFKIDNKLIKPFSTASSSSAPTPAVHDHSRLWTLERFVSAALIAVMPLAFITPHPYLDYALALSLVTHVHWGLEAIVVDYIRPKIFGTIIPKISVGLTFLLSILTLVGLYYFNYQDVGLSQAIMMYLKK